MSISEQSLTLLSLRAKSLSIYLFELSPFPIYTMHNNHCTINIHTGKKLSGKSRDEILEAIVKIYEDKFEIIAVQQNFDMIRVTFGSESEAVDALKEKGIRLFGIWCRIDGGPPITIIHLFDYPHEEDGDFISKLFEAYGLVKNVRRQRYISHPNIFTGTRLVDIVMEKAPPRICSINNYICRTWYRGQPIICNLCGAQGHKSASCPDKDKCRLCGKEGHMARSCPTPWGPPRRFPTGTNSEDDAPENMDVTAASEQEGANVNDIPAPVTSERAGASVVDTPVPVISEQPVVNTPVSQVSVGSPLSVGTPVAVNESSNSNENASQDIEEFSSPSLDSQSISDFSEESQSILPNQTVQIEVVNSGSVIPAASVSHDASPKDPVEAMDSSVCLKRKDCEEDSVESDSSPRVRLSRPRSSEPSRKLRATVSCSPASRQRGVHKRLPVVTSDRPPRV